MGAFLIYDIIEIWTLAKQPNTKPVDYAAPGGGIALSGVGIGSLFATGTLATVLGWGAAILGAPLSYWSEGKRENDIVNDILYPAILSKDVNTLNYWIDLDHWLGHPVDDDVLIKLIGKVKEDHPEVLSRNNKEWTAFWQKPETKHFRDTAAGRLFDLFRTAGEGQAATFFLESGIDFDNLKKEDGSALYDLEKRWGNREDEPLKNPYNNEASPVTLRELKARVNKFYEEKQQAPATPTKPADMATPAQPVPDLARRAVAPDLATPPKAQPDLQSPEKAAPPPDLKPAEAAPAAVPPVAKEDPVTQATADILKVKELRKNKKTNDAIRLALTIRGSLNEIETPEARHLKGTALAFIGTMHYEATPPRLQLAKQELTNALAELKQGKFKEKDPNLELAFVHFGLARVASKQENKEEALKQYKAAAREYEETIKDDRYTDVDKKKAKGNLSDIYSSMGDLVLATDRNTARTHFERALELAKEKGEKFLIDQANDGIKRTQQ